jgi:hypothetical protein
MRVRIGLALVIAACSSSAPPKAPASAPPETPAVASTGAPSAAPASVAPQAEAEPAPSTSSAAPAASAPLPSASEGADFVSALQNNPVLLQTMLGVTPDAKATFDHPSGKPLPETCALETVAWREVPSLYGIQGFTQVKDRAEAIARNARSYLHLKQHLVDLDGKLAKRKKAKPAHPGAELAVISVMHFAPGSDGVLTEWGEIYILGLRDCVITPLAVARTGAASIKQR